GRRGAARGLARVPGREQPRLQPRLGRLLRAAQRRGRAHAPVRHALQQQQRHQDRVAGGLRPLPVGAPAPRQRLAEAADARCGRRDDQAGLPAGHGARAAALGAVRARLLVECLLRGRCGARGDAAQDLPRRRGRRYGGRVPEQRAGPPERGREPLRGLDG
ncbi:unnamed protein product, partial [Prorocentrum cordatum]